MHGRLHRNPQALYDSLSMRRFVGIDLDREPVPDETTICCFRHLLEAHDFGKQMFEFIHAHLEAKGLRLSSGTIVDATIIHAQVRPRTKTRRVTRTCTRPRRATNGISARKRILATAANAHDSAVLGDLLHGEERDVLGDQAYQDQGDVIKETMPKAATAPTGVTGAAAW